MSALLDKIRSRGYWRVVIRPGEFVEKRVSNISELYPILQNNYVQLRGWYFPHLDSRTQPHIDTDWISQESEWDYYLELWRFYQSGQFVHLSGIREDWLDQSNLASRTEDWKPRELLRIGDTLLRFTEIFEFASRLSLTQAGDERMHIEIIPSGLQGRRLDSRDWWPLSRLYTASIQELPYRIDLTRPELIAATRELALKPAIELFRRFGWEPGVDILRDMQSELPRRGQRVSV